jgi:hypothetical protein
MAPIGFGKTKQRTQSTTAPLEVISRKDGSVVSHGGPNGGPNGGIFGGHEVVICSQSTLNYIQQF